MADPPAAPPYVVSRFEANLVRVLRFFLRQVPAEQALPLIEQRTGRPNCLSAACVHLVRDSLAKGCVLRLARSGGWRPVRHLRRGALARGRIWERHPVGELALRFSAKTLEFLIWVTAERPADPKSAWQAVEGEPTPADRFLLYLAYDAVRVEPQIANAFQARPVFAQNGLIRLAFPEDFTGPRAEARIDFGPWVSGPGATILEALQPELAERWLSVEAAKGQIGDWQRLRAVGQAQERTLAAFSDALEAANRRDLARFLLEVSSELLGAMDAPGVQRSPAYWIGGLQGAPPPRLADRIDTQRSALAVLRHLERLRQWERWARSVGYLDDDYDAAQLWLADWERHRGNERAEQAQEILRQVEPLRMQQPTVEGGGLT
jgi:hypothetical protein